MISNLLPTYFKNFIKQNKLKPQKCNNCFGDIVLEKGAKGWFAITSICGAFVFQIKHPLPEKYLYVIPQKIHFNGKSPCPNKTIYTDIDLDKIFVSNRDLIPIQEYIKKTSG